MYSLLTPYRSFIATVHVCHSGVIRGRFCSLHLTPLRIRTFNCVTISLDHKRHVALVVTATMTYALIHIAGSTIRAEFSCVDPADQSNVVAHSSVVTNRLVLSG